MGLQSLVPHKNRHATGGSDALSPSDIGAQPAGSYATLDSNQKLTPSQIPDLAITDFLGACANQTEMLAKTGQKGDWVTRSDDGKVYVITNTPTSEASSWTALSYPVAAAQQNADWTASSGVAQILNKPSTFAPSAHKSTHATGGADALTPADIGAVAKSGDTMTGKLNLPASTTTSVPLNLGNGVSPTTTVAGDVFASGNNIFFKGQSGGPYIFAYKNDSNTFLVPQIISTVSPSGDSAPALRITQAGGGEAFRVEDQTTPDPTAFVVSTTGRVGIGVTPDASVSLSVDNTGIKFNDGTIQTTAGASTAHKSTHATGGSDALTPEDIGAAKNLTLNSFTVPADTTIVPLSSNVFYSVLKNRADDFQFRLPETAANGDRIVVSRNSGTADGLINVQRLASNVWSDFVSLGFGQAETFYYTNIWTREVKQLGAVDKSGDTMTGKLNLPASTTSGSSLNIAQGADPSSPAFGDIWATTAGIRTRTGFISSPFTTTLAALERSQTFTHPQTINAGSTAGLVFSVTNNVTTPNLPNRAAEFIANGTAPVVTIVQNSNELQAGAGLLIRNANGTGECLRIEDESPETTPFVVSASGRVGIGGNPDSTVGLKLDSTGVKFGDNTVQTTAASTSAFTGANGTTAGTAGLVPVPAATDNTKFLKGDGTWAIADGLPVIGTENTYVFVLPGDDLEAAYAVAKTARLGWPFTDNPNLRYTIFILPGEYNLASELAVNGEKIDLVGLGAQTQRPVVTITGNTLNVTANDVRVSGISVGTQQFKTENNKPLQVFENCTGGNFSFAGGGYSTASGTYKDCKGGNYSFGVEASGTFTDCKGGDRSFGSGVGGFGTASGTFTNCTGGDSSFGGDTASGTFTNCTGGDYSFVAAGSQGNASGTFTNCKGGPVSFGGGGTASGTFTNCTGGDRSFGSYGTLSGRLISCRLTSGSFPNQLIVSGAGFAFVNGTYTQLSEEKLIEHNGFFAPSNVVWEKLGGRNGLDQEAIRICKDGNTNRLFFVNIYYNNNNELRDNEFYYYSSESYGTLASVPDSPIGLTFISNGQFNGDNLEDYQHELPVPTIAAAGIIRLCLDGDNNIVNAG